MRRSFLLALALAAGTLVPGASAAAVAGVPQATSDPGSIGIRLLDAPVATAKDPRARTYIVDHLKPGAVIHRRVEVGNTTDATQRVAVYPGGASITGGSFIPAVGRTPSELTQWTKVDHATVSLKPNQRSAVAVTIKIPADASPGERYGVVWAEVAGAAPKGGSGSGGGVSLVNRVGVRLYVSVGGGNAPASKFDLNGLAAHRADDGTPTVTAQVHNTGGRALDLSGTLNLTDGPGGLRAGPFPAELGVTLASGDSSPVTILLDPQIPDGPWQAELTLTSGLLKETTKATLLFPESAGTLAATGAQHGFPWWIVGLGAGAIGLGWLLLLLWRRRHEDEPDERNSPNRHRSGAGIV